MKICEACKLEMEENAYKCPHCHTYSKWLKNPQNQAIALSIFMVLLLIPFVLFAKSYTRKLINPPLQPNPKVSLTNLHVEPYYSKCYDSWQVLGYIKNEDEAENFDFWVKLEMFDSTGNLIDVGYEHVKEVINTGDSTAIDFVSNNNKYIESWKYKIVRNIQ